MDRRLIVHSAILHISDAQKEIDNLLQNNPNQNALTELNLAYKSLDDSIRHCKGIFGPSTLDNDYPV